MLPAISASRSVLAPLSRRWWLMVGLAVMAAPSVLAVQRQAAWSMTVPNLYSFKYLLYLPTGYNPDAATRWPLMVFLHGAGQRGTNIESVAASGPTKFIELGRDYPCIVVSPQCAGSWWSAADLQPFIEDIVKQYRVDSDRVYLTGLSMGGYGTWDLAVRSPGFYAAIVPLCGAGTPSQAYQLRDLPVWAFHGALDATVPVARTQEMIDAIQRAGGNPLVTIYPNLGHDVWTVTYANDALYTWMFAQSRANVTAPPITGPTHAVPPPTSVSATPATSPAVPDPAPNSGGSGGGGGGAIEAWFVAALALLGIARRLIGPRA